jgi:sirohydrochlorin cobaltochelatase
MKTPVDPPLPVASATEGLLLFAHGARDPRWAEPFQAVAARLAVLCPVLQTRLAFLELMSPSLPQAAADLVTAGCRSITVLPMFLGAGGHVRRDLPELITQLRLNHPHTTFEVTEALGEMPDMLDAMASTIAQQLAGATQRVAGAMPASVAAKASVQSHGSQAAGPDAA